MEKKEKASSFPCQKASSFPCHLWFKQIWLPNEFHILCSIRLSSKLWWKVGSYQVGVFGLSSLAAGCPSTSCSEYPKIIKKSMQSFPLQSLFVSSAFRKIACFIPKKNLETMTLSQSSCHLAVPEREELSPKDLELMARDWRYALATRASICIRHQVIDRRWMGRQASEQRMVCIYLMWEFSCHGVVELGQTLPFPYTTCWPIHLTGSDQPSSERPSEGTDKREPLVWSAGAWPVRPQEEDICQGVDDPSNSL